MKKIKMIVVAVLAALFTCSCEDNGDNYVEQLYTNAQKEAAFTACLSSSLDSAFSHLCVYDGFYQYNEAHYRIDYGNLVPAVFDVLEQNQLGYLADSLILYTNRMAESCNASVVGELFTNAIKNVTYYNHDALITDSISATPVTDYFVQYKAAELRTALQGPVAIRMSLFRVNDFWGAIMNQYNALVSAPVNVDVQNYVIDKMLAGIFEEMRIEEQNIRSDSTHRVDADTLLAN